MIYIDGFKNIVTMIILFMFDLFSTKKVYKIMFMIDLGYMQSIKQFVDSETRSPLYDLSF